jgi:hypothetical protein
MLNFKKKPLVSAGLTACLSGHEIVELPQIKHSVNEIRNLVSASHEVYEALYLSTLHRLAEFCQAMPFSHMQFNVPYGMLKRQLTLTIAVLKIRRGKLLPKNAGTEAISAEDAAWTYALFSSSLLSDIYSVQHDRKVTLHRANDDPAGIWTPISGSLFEKACHYRMEFIEKEPATEKSIFMAAISGRIISPAAIRWLAGYPALYYCWWKTILHETSDENVLQEIIKEAAKKSSTLLYKKEEKTTLPLNNTSVFEEFTSWLVIKENESPGQVFQIQKGLFVSETFLSDFLKETGKSDSTLFLQGLMNDNYLILKENSFYHSLAPIKFENRRILNGIILDRNFLPKLLKTLPINNDFKDNIQL